MADFLLFKATIIAATFYHFFVYYQKRYSFIDIPLLAENVEQTETSPRWKHAFLSISLYNLQTFLFFFVTVTNLHKPSILPPKLHLLKINKPMSRLFGSKGQKMARNWQNDKKLSVTLGMSGSIHHMTVIFGTLV